jgi:hypothetical protein
MSNIRTLCDLEIDEGPTELIVAANTPPPRLHSKATQQPALAGPEDEDEEEDLPPPPEVCEFEDGEETAAAEPASNGFYFARHPPRRVYPAYRKAVAFLVECLGDGPVRISDVRQLAVAAHVSWIAVIGAKKLLNVRAHNPNGHSNGWWWSL